MPLRAAIASTGRYSSSGELTREATAVLFKLETIGEIDHADFLNVVVSSQQWGGLIPTLAIYDESGDTIPHRTLHNSEGVLVVQAKDVEPNHAYYVAVTPAAAAARYQVGGFDLFAEYSIHALAPTEIGTFSLTAANPIVEQKFTVSSSRLIHLLVSTVSESHTSGRVAVWGTLVDLNNEVVAQLAMNLGDSRSAPLVFLQPGDYRLILETGSRDGSRPAPVKLAVFVDEISMDVGPGVVDPTLEPLVSCQQAGANPGTCYDPVPIILIEGPIFPDPTVLPPTPIYPSLPPWQSPAWFYWPEAEATSNVLYRHNTANAMDVSGDHAVTALDALLVINELNASSPTGSTAFLDTSGDGMVSALDVLLVINSLNSKSNGEGELGSNAERADNAISSFWAGDIERKK